MEYNIHMSKKTKVEIIKTTNTNVKVGDKFGVNILNNSGCKTKGKDTGGGGKRKPKEPKQPRMTINQLAIEMRAGFAAVNQRIDKLEENDKQIFTRLNKIEDKVENISDVLIRNNLK
jgi:tetrahydromethanopterin S-methyltransferase subunit G